jgi:sugar phosphate isomerase/epimerase
MIYISSSAINSNSIEHCLKELINAGIRNIELSGGTKYCVNVLETLKKYKEKYSLNFLIHNYFPIPEEDFVLNIASHDERARQDSIQFVKKSIDMAYNLEIDFYTLHAGYAGELLPNTDGGYFKILEDSGKSTESAFEIMFESISEVVGYAEEYNIAIGIENLFPFDGSNNCSLLCTPDYIFQFLDRIFDNDNIGFLLDLGHLYISANRFGFDKDGFIMTLSKKYQNKLLGIHLSGNDGKTDNHDPLSDDSWQLCVTKKFDLKSIPVTIECRGLSTDKILKQFQMIEDALKRSA